MATPGELAIVDAGFDNLSCETAEDAAARQRCYLLVGQLPAAGLREAEEALTEMCDYYSSPVEPTQVIAPPLPVKAKLAGTVIRPVYPATGED